MTHANSKRSAVAALVFIALCSVACSVQVAGNLDEVGANRALLALDRGGIAASKEPDARFDGRLIITVPSTDETRAVSLLAREGLPAEEPPSILGALGGDTLVLSASAEEAKLRVGLAGELSRSIAAIDGVQSARVHLSPAPSSPALGDEIPPSPLGASVLLRHRGPTPPITVSDVQRLVAGAVPGITAAEVEVVMVPSLEDEASKPHLTRIGPFGISNGSITAFKGFVVTLVLLNLLLIGVVAALWLKLRQRRLESIGSRSHAVTELADTDEAR